MKQIDRLIKEFGVERWFTQPELPGVTQHTMDALVNKEFLERSVGAIYGMPYYRRLKELGDES